MSTFRLPPGKAVGSNSNTALDIALPADFEDSISDLAWSSKANHLAVASWDHKVRIYDVNKDGIANGAALLSFDQGVLSCHWSTDGTKCVGAGVDKTARVLDLASGSTEAQIVAMHDAPIRSVRFVEIPQAQGPIIATASWDQTVKYWDMRQSVPVATLKFDSKIYSMDARSDLMVVGTADRNVHIINLSQPTTIATKRPPTLSHQTRVVTCFRTGDGYYIGSTEGRAGWVHLDPQKSALNATFKCHRSAMQNNNTDVFPVNAISSHPTFPDVFATAGADGKFNYWNKTTKQRMCGFEDLAPAAQVPQDLVPAITATGFSEDGVWFAYAYAYDWSKGWAHNRPEYPSKVILHAVKPEEIKKGIAGWGRK